jgi:hypothetical protein
LLNCAFDQCAVTAEIKKGKYVYYHCTGYTENATWPISGRRLGGPLGEILKNIHIPEDTLRQLQDSLRQDSKEIREGTDIQRTRREQRLSTVRRRIEQAYLDKLEGKISEEFWASRNAEWQEEANGVVQALSALQTANPDRLLRLIAF